MKPKPSPCEDPQGDLFKIKLQAIVDQNHAMVKLALRVGAAGVEAMLKETIAAGLALKAIKPSQLARVNVDTTVQERHVRFPTGAASSFAKTTGASANACC